MYFIALRSDMNEIFGLLSGNFLVHFLQEVEYLLWSAEFSF